MADIAHNGELMGIFYEEAQSLIDEMRQGLSDLSQGQETGRDQSAVLRRLFRCAHIIKSSSASVGLDELKKVTEALERIFKKAGDEEFVMTADIISLLSESVQVCQKLLNEQEIADHKELLDRLNTVLQPCGG